MAVRRHLKTLSSHRMNDVIILPMMTITLRQAIESAIADFIQCHRLEANTEVMCEAIILAVDYG